jgi:hypothetical protein
VLLENKKIVKYVVVALSLIAIITLSDYAIKKIVKMKSTSDEDIIATEMLSSTDFILGLKKTPQLEYVVGDTLINIDDSNEYYKTFENNRKYEVFINKNTEEISSLHFTSNVDDMNEEDIKYLKIIYNLSFSNLSSYMLEKTNSLIETMGSSEYISKKSTVISKNSSITETIPIGKTSEIKITAFYIQNELGKNEIESIDVSILKGNKW